MRGCEFETQCSALCSLYVIKYCTDGSDCGSVGRVVASDTRDAQFESSHQSLENFIYCQLYCKD